MQLSGTSPSMILRRQTNTMKSRAICGLAMLAVLLSQPVLSEETKEKVQVSPETAILKLDLLAQRRATLQAKTDWLAAEQLILKAEISAYQEGVKKAQAEMNQVFGCEFDLDKRACRPSP